MENLFKEYMWDSHFEDKVGFAERKAVLCPGIYQRSEAGFLTSFLKVLCKTTQDSIEK